LIVDNVVEAKTRLSTTFAVVDQLVAVLGLGPERVEVNARILDAYAVAGRAQEIQDDPRRVVAVLLHPLRSIPHGHFTAVHNTGDGRSRADLLVRLKL